MSIEKLIRANDDATGHAKGTTWRGQLAQLAAIVLAVFLAKGAMLIGNGPTDLHRITMIGNDLALDSGVGTCGKNGQGVPVGVGQPTLLMERITVGGTGR